ncbi:hypothetical protein ACFQX6_32200 [Streptosporangium lutulentum]
MVLPLLRPALVAVGSFAFIHSWNNFLFALMFVSDQEKFTVPVGLSYTLGEFSVDFGALAAAASSPRCRSCWSSPSSSATWCRACRRER